MEHIKITTVTPCRDLIVTITIHINNRCRHAKPAFSSKWKACFDLATDSLDRIDLFVIGYTNNIHHTIILKVMHRRTGKHRANLFWKTRLCGTIMVNHVDLTPRTCGRCKHNLKILVSINVNQRWSTFNIS